MTIGATADPRTDAAPTGVRRISTGLALAAVGGLVIAVCGVVAWTQLSAARPALARVTMLDLVPRDHDIVAALRMEIIFGVLVAVACGRLAVWVRRPSTTARVVTFFSACVLGLLLAMCAGDGAGTEVATAVGRANDPAVVDALRHLVPSWYIVTARAAEFVVGGGLLGVVLFLLRRRYADFYREGPKDAASSFWASEKINQ